jgi:hypothetical protein
MHFLSKGLLLLALVLPAAVPPAFSATRYAPHGVSLVAIATHQGRVNGRLLQVGGPGEPGGGTPRQPVPGFVRVTGHGQVVKRVTVPRNGRFTLSLLPGRYRLSGYMHRRQVQPSCHTSHPVVVRAGETTHVKVVCPVP